MLSRARLDDTASSIEERLKWYREQTLPVVEYFRQRPNTKVHDINGTNDIVSVHQDILKALSL